MEWTFELREEPELLRITVSGDFSSSRLGVLLDELVALPYWHRGIPLLFDLQSINLTEVASMELIAASERVVQMNSALAHTPVAILMATPADMEIGMRFGQITAKRTLADLHGFLNESDAVRWLNTYAPSLIAAFGFIYP